MSWIITIPFGEETGKLKWLYGRVVGLCVGNSDDWGHA